MKASISVFLQCVSDFSQKCNGFRNWSWLSFLFLLDGNTYDSGSDVTFSLQSLIPGFTEAVTNMQVGQEAMVYIHPSYGYGENGTSNIEPNSLLIFRINLKGIAK